MKIFLSWFQQLIGSVFGYHTVHYYHAKHLTTLNSLQHSQRGFWATSYLDFQEVTIPDTVKTIWSCVLANCVHKANQKSRLMYSSQKMAIKHVLQDLFHCRVTRQDNLTYSSGLIQQRFEAEQKVKTESVMERTLHDSPLSSNQLLLYYIRCTYTYVLADCLKFCQ